MYRSAYKLLTFTLGYHTKTNLCHQIIRLKIRRRTLSKVMFWDLVGMSCVSWQMLSLNCSIVVCWRDFSLKVELVLLPKTNKSAGTNWPRLWLLGHFVRIISGVRSDWRYFYCQTPTCFLNEIKITSITASNQQAQQIKRSNSNNKFLITETKHSKLQQSTSVI